MACPVSLITGMFSQNNPFGGTRSCSNPNTGPSSAVKRVAVRELLVDESTMEQGSALEGREVTNACGKGWYSSKEDASYTTDVASVSTTNDTKQSATKAEEGHMGTPPLVKIEPMPMSSGTQIGTNAIVKTKDEGVLPQRRLLRLAPAPAKVCAPVCATTTCVVPSGGTILELEERRKKMELRKARNRESAQRSNYKRKMKLQALREELEKVSRREKLLRARERTLRQENISLRMTGSR